MTSGAGWCVDNDTGAARDCVVDIDENPGCCDVVADANADCCVVDVGVDATAGADEVNGAVGADFDE